jgi:hypothetical protein
MFCTYCTVIMVILQIIPLAVIQLQGSASAYLAGGVSNT